MSHDQNFKNLILDYPHQALAFFAAEEAAEITADTRVVPVRQEQLKERLGERFRELVPLAKRINRLTFDKDIGALFAQQKLDEQLLRIGVRHPLQDGGPSRELPKDYYRNGIFATGMNEQKSSGLRHRR